ncbi:MAG: carboxylating nicotinate-nucleotide diphosphorylase [bacterium]|nr:carboxylating nicotinate-nucleotide diphosphorylase [bacterium]
MRLQELVKAALAEDIGSGDVTTELTVDIKRTGCGRIIARERGVLSGMEVVHEVFRQIDKGLEIIDVLEDSQSVVKNDVICEIRGRYSSIITGERTALNFLSRLSGIATLTRKFVTRVSGTEAVILDTRKTTPLLRSLEKAAVLHGGGRNHRKGLYDMVLIKDNHEAATGGLSAALNAVFTGFKKIGKKLPLEIEIQRVEQLREVFKYPVERIMLDNFTLDMIEKAVKLAKGKVPLEVSGGVSLLNVREIAQTGVDFISIGALTHSAPGLDFTLIVE